MAPLVSGRHNRIHLPKRDKLHPGGELRGGLDIPAPEPAVAVQPGCYSATRRAPSPPAQLRAGPRMISGSAISRIYLKMHLYNLTLQQASAIQKAIYGNFSSSKAQELVVCRGKTLELYRIDERYPAGDSAANSSSSSQSSSSASRVRSPRCGSQA